ncbi:Oidioi.mRNA.OKI2018_I69.XSR.g15048.t1.cds [Oikopleura dioica]|uniref:Oidioi.mRNA.OKI2018_I69.XSR.g15048.t1.cds n=1 Tax=Oikopleura dioica TaxID=34765 RepID=A0ABN7SFJ8_OIKDI|nr:Oidioi.mRNA.OKI2018_I69.XSR.g15048.t1.cds [Oikopleura dioica]
MKLSAFVFGCASAKVMFHTRNPGDCHDTCVLNRVCQFWTFDNRMDPETEQRRHECHHQNHNSYESIHDAEYMQCGSFSEPQGAVHSNCRFEFGANDFGRKFIQTHTPKQCMQIYELCRECSAYEWREYDTVTGEIDGHSVTEHVPGHCVLRI